MFPVLSANGSSGYNLTNSLRFRSSASAYLSRTPASAGNRQIFTWSGWVKRGALDSASEYTLFSAGAGSPNYDSFRFTVNQLQFFQTAGSISAVQTTQLFRDPSAWYHIILAVDTTQATASNRIKMYVNGSQITAFASAAYPAQNSSAAINNTNAHAVGALWISSAQQYLDGYMAEVNFIDGQALTPSSFGSTNATTGVWQPAKYTGTYGTNGFYLNFNSIALTSGSNTGLGKDNSGNGNYWNTNNISVTAGTTYDAMTDVPTLTSATVGNYATLNPVDSYVASISQANLNFADGAGSAYQAYSTIASPDITAYKFYCEVTVAPSYGIGIAPDTKTGAGSTTDRTGFLAYYSTGVKQNGSGTATAYGASFTTGDIIGIAIGSGQIEFYKNNVSQGVAFSSLTGAYKFGVWAAGAAGTGCSFNFGQRPFTYTPPTGFVALNTYNLPTPTILQGNKYMDATTYTGNGSSQVIVNQGQFQPDFVWIKNRAATYWHELFDINRGVGNSLSTNATDQEYNNAGFGYLSAFNSNGFTVTRGSSDAFNVNSSGVNYIGWSWKAANTTSSNTNGSITSTVSANTTAGFSVVTWTGVAGGGTIGHGLGVAPKFIITKSKSGVTDWLIYHASLGNTNYIYLNLATATGASVVAWNNTSPTSSVFSTGTYFNSGNWVAYCFAEIAGFNKFGSYTGNGSADGPFIYTGFRPKCVMLKRSDTGSSDWWMQDTSRSTYNAANALLFPDLSQAEYTTAGVEMDILSNGFKIKNTNNNNNASGGTFIYAAFAENSFKNALAR
jgi:hypothetical protein